MTKEEGNRMIELIQAQLDGKQIQLDLETEVTNIEIIPKLCCVGKSSHIGLIIPEVLRVKPEPKYGLLSWDELAIICTSRRKVRSKGGGQIYFIDTLKPNKDVVTMCALSDYPEWISQSRKILVSAWVFDDTGLPVGKEINRN